MLTYCNANMHIIHSIVCNKIIKTCSERKPSEVNEMMSKAINHYKINEKTIKDSDNWNRFHFYCEFYHNFMKQKTYERRMYALKKINTTNINNFIETVKKYLDNSDEIINDLYISITN